MIFQKYYNATEGEGGNYSAERTTVADFFNAPAEAPVETPTNDPADTPAEAPQQSTAPETIPAPAETPAAEQSAPVEVLPADAPAPQAPNTEPAPVIDWRDSIKEVDPTDVLRQVGLHDDLIGLIQHYNTHGNLDAYYEAKVKNWDNVANEDLLREQVQSEYAGVELSAEDLEELVKDKLENTYKQSELLTDNERRLGRLKFQQEMNQIRAARKAEQAKFQVQPIDLSARQREAEAAAQAAKDKQDMELRQLVEKINGSPVIQKLQQERKVSVKAGDAQVTITVDPQVITEASTNLNKLFEGAYDANGHITPAWAETLAFHFGRDSFKKALVDQGKSLGAKELATEQVNPSSRQPAPAEVKTKSLGQNLNEGNFRMIRVSDL